MNTAYVVLARKWRPAQFSDIVGQTHVVKTLMNAIRVERVHQAYLFTGSRGIGKTSIARIFAKALRCPNRKEENSWLKSCDQCSSCQEIARSSSIDVLEIDGASNNGVDAIREIRENAKFLPSTGSKKIYIIDEVHMLTTAAFNALLKTLEEPPAHVIFILATTEPHKIPATILSRCQRFDFKRTTLAQIQNRLLEISKAENLEAEPAALALIAKGADGSMRDALSLLDQTIAFGGATLSAQSVRESIGLIESLVLLKILESTLDRKPTEALKEVQRAYQDGHDLKLLTKGLIELLYQVILCKTGHENLELTQTEEEEIRKISLLRSLEELELIFQVLHHGLDTLARSHQPKMVLDVLLIKCAVADTLVLLEQSPRVTAEANHPLSSNNPSPSVLQPAVKTEHHEPKTWVAFIEYVRKTRPLLASLLEHANQADLPNASSAILQLFYPPQEVYKSEQLKSRLFQEQLRTLAQEFYGPAFGHQNITVQILVKEGTGESLVVKRERETREKEAAAQKTVQNNPVIQEAKSLFGGTLGPIEWKNHAHP